MRRFIDIDDINNRIPLPVVIPIARPKFKHIRYHQEIPDFVDLPGPKNVTSYKVVKLAFDLLPILLARLKALGGLRAQEIAIFMRSHPPFYSKKGDLLELEKIKTAQAVEEFLKA
jgi:hypothetical protein